MRTVDGVAQAATLGPDADDLVLANQFHESEMQPVDDRYPPRRQRPAETLAEPGDDPDRRVGEDLQGLGVLVGPEGFGHPPTVVCIVTVPSRRQDEPAAFLEAKAKRPGHTVGWVGDDVSSLFTAPTFLKCVTASQVSAVPAKMSLWASSTTCQPGSSGTSVSLMRDTPRHASALYGWHGAALQTSDVTVRRTSVYRIRSRTSMTAMNRAAVPLIRRSRSQSVIGYLEGFCGEVIRTGAVDAKLFALGVAPFVAGLLIRHPSLATPTWSELGTVHKRSLPDELAGREQAFWRTVDHLVFNARWTLIESRPPLVTTDLGYLWLPGEGMGTLHVPIHPHAMLQLAPGRTFYLGDKTVYIDVQHGNDTLLCQSQVGMIADATEVYGMDRELVELAHAIMHCDGPLEIDGVDMRLLAQSRQMAHIATQVGAANPVLAWRRFHLAQHDLFECRCTEENKAAGMSAAEMLEWDAYIRIVDTEARVSIPRRDVITPWDLMLGSAYTERPLQIEPPR